MEAYQAIQGWIRAGAVPSEPQRVDPQQATGASVTLRLSGAVVGRASVVDEEGLAVWRASRDAWAEARRRLRPDTREGADDEPEHAELVERTALIAIDLQIAGPLTPIGGAGLEEAAGEASPGLHGVAARVGRRFEAVFPGTMLATNITPAQGLVIAMSALDLPRAGIGDPRVNLDALRREHGLSLYRFEVAHLAQVSSDRPPRFLYRGGRVRQMSEINERSLREFGDGLFEHILAHRWVGEEPFGLMSAYRPWAGDYEQPMIAEARSQALAAYALARWSALMRTEATEALALHYAEAAASLLEKLAQETEEGPDIGASATAAALSLLARAALGADSLSAEANELLDRRCLSLAVEMLENQSASAGERAIVAFALARLSSGDEAPVERDRVRAVVRELFRTTSAGDLPSLMPWLGWAELAMVEDQPDVPAGVALRSFRSTVWRHQVEPRDVGEEGLDLVGGIVFTRGRAPLPSWHTLRPLAFIATMLGDDRLTDDEEVGAELLRLMGSIRFVLQLSVDETHMHMFRDRGRSLGGVRLAPWDHRLTPEANAMALLTVAETLESVRRRR
ncbi:MAG: hypothetical protein EA376_00735 [Phycisphaeraceae bacterium]|nr:MAG: hypothetical protein EA376_00735 [Phycisphaeraceae bacterium]